MPILAWLQRSVKRQPDGESGLVGVRVDDWRVSVSQGLASGDAGCRQESVQRRALWRGQVL